MEEQWSERGSVDGQRGENLKLLVEVRHHTDFQTSVAKEQQYLGFAMVMVLIIDAKVLTCHTGILLNGMKKLCLRC